MSLSLRVVPVIPKTWTFQPSMCHARHPNVQLAHPTAPHLHPGGNGFGDRGHPDKGVLEQSKPRSKTSKNPKNTHPWEKETSRDASNISNLLKTGSKKIKKRHRRLQDSPCQAHLHAPATAQVLDWLTEPVTSGTDGKLQPHGKSVCYGRA